jgi:glycosyltransferase involved in cell wall biosynthesis
MPPYVRSFAPERGSGARARIAGLRRAVRAIAPRVDLVAAHAPEHAWPVLDLARRKPLVVHFHGPRTLELIAERAGTRRIAFARVAETLTYARTVRFIALSQANADILIRQYRVRERHVRVVPGAVDGAQFRSECSQARAREILGWPAARPTVVAARRLAVTKGIDALIDATALVRREVPNVFVALAGAGPLREALQARIDELGLAEHVRLVGQLDSETLPLAYRAADVSIVPSSALEGFGLSVLESLACGTPALVTPVSGLPEVVTNLDRRLVLAGTAPRELAAGLVGALTSPGELPSAAECARYAHQFDWSAIAARVKRVYEEVL